VFCVNVVPFFTTVITPPCQVEPETFIHAVSPGNW
jgi:hypothetical protein